MNCDVLVTSEQTANDLIVAADSHSTPSYQQSIIFTYHFPVANGLIITVSLSSSLSYISCCVFWYWYREQCDIHYIC